MESSPAFPPQCLIDSDAISSSPFLPSRRGTFGPLTYLEHMFEGWSSNGEFSTFGIATCPRLQSDFSTKLRATWGWWHLCPVTGARLLVITECFGQMSLLWLASHCGQKVRGKIDCMQTDCAHAVCGCWAHELVTAGAGRDGRARTRPKSREACPVSTAETLLLTLNTWLKYLECLLETLWGRSHPRPCTLSQS